MPRLYLKNKLPLLFLLPALLLTCKEDKNIPPPPPYPIENDLTIISPLPEVINESSGLVFFNNQLWTHNDGTGDNRLYQISDTTAELLDSIKLSNTSNKDWEDITQDDTHIFIGDFGNNAGDRQDLKIYKIPKANFLATTDTIAFSFEDQLNFDGPLNGHNFDCEAMITYEDSIYLFSKNHSDQQLRLYQLPKTAGEYSAKLKATFDCEGLITGAAISDQTLCLLGYNKNIDSFEPFVWVFYNFTDSDFLNANHFRIDFTNQEQMEGIASYINGQFFISSESEGTNQGKLFLFDAEKWK